MKHMQQKQHTKRLAKQQAGFTIVELMIATTVFSLILLIITFGVIYFTRNYYNGVYTSATQNAARDITNTVSNVIRFGTGDVELYAWPPGPTAGDDAYFCAGGYVFVAELGVKYSSLTDGMYMQPMPSGCSVPLTTTGRQQLLGENMRITYMSLSLDSVNGVYTFDIGIAYGDNDLLVPNTGIGDAVRCATEAGSEFCATARHSATVQQRVTNV